MPRIKINPAFSLYYESKGNGIPIVFITGFSADHLIWQQTAEYFAKDYQTFNLDNRGSGQADCPDMPYTVEMMADDAINFCKTLQLERCHFIGLSMGSAIVQTIARKYPEFVRSIVLTAPFTKIDIKFALFAQAKSELLKTAAAQSTLARATLGWAFSSAYLQQEGMVDLLLNNTLANPYPITEIGYRNQLNALLSFDSTSWLKKINVPCFIIGSDEDMIVSAAHSRDMANTIPQAQYYCFAGVGHLPHIECSAMFNQMVCEFLARCA
jgi:pimeloyl-ACP methyl ester carboxylesterase